MAGCHNLQQRGNGAVRKWGDNEEIQREREEMERECGIGEKKTLSISSFFLHFHRFSPFPTSKFVIFRHKMLKYGTFVAKVTKKLTYAL